MWRWNLHLDHVGSNWSRPWPLTLFSIPRSRCQPFSPSMLRSSSLLHCCFFTMSMRSIEIFTVILILCFHQCTESFTMTIIIMIVASYFHHHCTLAEIIITLTVSMPRVYSNTVMILITFSLYAETVILVTASHYVETVTLVTVIKASSRYAETATEIPLRFSSFLVCRDYRSA